MAVVHVLVGLCPAVNLHHTSQVLKVDFGIDVDLRRDILLVMMCCNVYLLL